ncbi:hypothetical protein Asal01_01162 [Fodinibius salicampi]
MKLAGVNPLLKGILYFIGGLVLILLILQLAIFIWGNNYVESQLRAQLRQSNTQGYSIDFEDLDLRVFSGSATIRNIRVDTDTSLFSSTDDTSSAPRFLFTGSLGQLSLSGVNVFSSLMGEELHIGTLTLDSPDISALKNPNEVSRDDGSFSSVDSTILAGIPDRYTALEIGEIIIKNGHGKLTQTDDTLSSLQQLNLSLREIRVDSASAQSGRLFITDNISLDARDFTMHLSDSLNTIAFNHLSIYSDDQTVALDSLQLNPRYGKLEFARRHGTTIDRIDLAIPNIRFESVDFPQLVESGRIYAGYGHISDLRLEDYLNRGIPPGPPVAKPLPFVAFRDLNIPVKMDSLHIENAYISYSEYVGDTPRAGTITFEQTDAIFRNISNYPEDVEKGITTTLDAESQVMGTGLLDVHFEFPMDTQNGFHKIEGKLSEMSMPHFNQMVEHVAFIRIDNGQLDSLTFEMTLDQEQSSGTLVMNYENFSISVLNKQSIKQHGLLENFKTFLANNFIVRKKNIPGNDMQAGRIDFERDESKSIFNYWWKSLLSGIKDSIRK